MIKIPSEKHEQIKLNQWCKIKKLLAFSIPNGGTRNKLEAIGLKKEGLLKGASDFVVLLPNKILFIELKRQKKKLKSGKLSSSNSKTSKEQLEFLERVNGFGYATGKVCFGFNMAKEFILSEMK